MSSSDRRWPPLAPPHSALLSQVPLVPLVPAFVGLFVIALTFAGCGYGPVYGAAASSGTGGVGRDAEAADAQASDSPLGMITIAAISDRSGQILRNDLIDRLHAGGRAAATRYRLEVEIDESDRELGIAKDASRTRAQYIVETEYRLVALESGRTVTAGATRSVTSFNIVEGQYAADISERDAQRRALVDAGYQITSRLATHFATGSDEAGE